jgi:hypothetical protein
MQRRRDRGLRHVLFPKDGAHLCGCRLEVSVARFNHVQDQREAQT